MDRVAARRSGWLLPALLLMGCATTGRIARGSARADGEAAGEEGALASADEDRGLSAAVLERSAYVAAVLRRNRSIESARQAWRAAIGRARQAGSFEDPSVTVDVAPLSIGSSTARFGWDATISQHLPWPGKLSLDEAVGQAEADAAQRDFEASCRELALTAALLFDQYFVAVRSIEINAQHVQLMRTLQAAAIAQYESGRGSVQDGLQAEIELTHMEHDALILASRRDVTVAQMNELLHRDPEAPLPPPPRQLPRPPAPAVSDARRLEAEAVQRRPDILAARQRARAERARAERASREYLPDVTVSTSYDTMWDLPQQRWMVGLGFNLPVQTGRRAGAVDEARAMQARYEADAARMSDAARTQVVVALKRLEESEHVLHLFAERLLPVARAAVDAARAAFTASRTPFASAVEAEKNLRDVELDQQLALADYDRRRAELDRALGRMPGVAASGGTP